MEIIAQYADSIKSRVETPSTETYLETLPSIGESIVLHIINVSQPITGYQIRKRFTQTTNKKLSFEP